MPYKNRRWFHVNNYTNYPPTSYGFAVNPADIVCDANDIIRWAVGKPLTFVQDFFKDKKVDLAEIIPEQQTGEQCKLPL